MKLEEDTKFTIRTIGIILLISMPILFILSGFDIEYILEFLFIIGCLILIEVAIGELLFRYKWKSWTWS